MSIIAPNGYLEKPFFCKNLRGDIYFCDHYLKKVDKRGEDYYMLECYPLFEIKGLETKFNMNSNYLDLYTNPVSVSNAENSNLALLEDSDLPGSIFITSKDELKGNYPQIYYVYSPNDSKKIGEMEFSQELNSNKITLLPKKFKILVELNP